MDRSVNPPLLGPSEVAIPSLQLVQRSTVWVAILLTTAALFLIGLNSPVISAKAGVTLGQGVLVVAVFLGASALANVAFRLWGSGSPLYRFFDYLEGFALSWGIAYLIRVSSSLHSFFWIFHGIQLLVTALGGYSIVYLLTVCVGPAYLVAAFVWQGEVGSAWRVARSSATRRCDVRPGGGQS
jgi:hypothetical protein